jgi:AcrR family transcriptional regulator
LRLDTGRAGQKGRTRQALLAAVRRVMERGEPVSVVAAANEAGISKATAYRYFPASDALTLEATLDARVAAPEEIVGDAEDVRERVLRVQRYLFSLTRGSETQFRLFLARALDASVADGGRVGREIRGGRRLPMYEFALSPVRPRMAGRDFDFLVLSLSAASGLESYLALKDVCRVDDATADRVATSNVEAILDRLLPEDGAGAPVEPPQEATRPGRRAAARPRRPTEPSP